jgi:hypothetical protein
MWSMDKEHSRDLVDHWPLLLVPGIYTQFKVLLGEQSHSKVQLLIMVQSLKGLKLDSIRISCTVIRQNHCKTDLAEPLLRGVPFRWRSSLILFFQHVVVLYIVHPFPC